MNQQFKFSQSPGHVQRIMCKGCIIQVLLHTAFQFAGILTRHPPVCQTRASSQALTGTSFTQLSNTQHVSL